MLGISNFHRMWLKICSSYPFFIWNKSMFLSTISSPPPFWGGTNPTPSLVWGSSQGSHPLSYPFLLPSQLLVHLQYHFLWTQLQRQICKADLNPTSDSLVFADFLVFRLFQPGVALLDLCYLTRKWFLEWFIDIKISLVLQVQRTLQKC